MAKKKWKKRLKKLAKAALIGGALYGGAKLLKNRGMRGNVEKTAAMEDANIGVTHLPDTSGYITQKVDAPVLRKPPIGRMRGVGTDAEAIAAQDKRANYATNARINALNTAEGPPSIDNPYRARQHLRFRSKGGRVTGIAKRGFGRALMKGKK